MDGRRRRTTGGHARKLVQTCLAGDARHADMLDVSRISEVVHVGHLHQHPEIVPEISLASCSPSYPSVCLARDPDFGHLRVMSRLFGDFGALPPQRPKPSVHRHLGKRRWDDSIQATVSGSVGEPLQSVAQSREAWRSIEAAFIARMTRVAPSGVEVIPVGRHVLAESGPAEAPEWTGLGTLAGHSGSRPIELGIRSHRPACQHFRSFTPSEQSTHGRGEPTCAGQKHKIGDGSIKGGSVAGLVGFGVVQEHISILSLRHLGRR